MKIQRIVVTGMFLSGCLLGTAVAAEQQAQGQAVEAKVSPIQKKEVAVVEKTQPVGQGNAIDPAAISDVQKDDGFVSSRKIMQDAMNEFKEQRGIELGVENERGQSFYENFETVAVDETNPQWAKWRVIAYKKAYMKIKEQFVEDIYGKLAGEMLHDYLKDESDNRLEFSLPKDPRAYTKTQEIWNKLAALAGGKLDRLLEELDIDPEQFNAAPPEQRKKLLKDNFTQKNVIRAVGSLGGLIPIKTFEGVDKKGNYSIGVIAMYYDKLKQLAYDIVHKRHPMLAKKAGNPIRSYIPKTDKDLAQSFGVRLVFNESGKPILVSYGQWSYVYKGKDQRKLDRSYDYAKKKAKIESKSQIVQFLNSKAHYEIIGNEDARNEEISIIDRDGNLRMDDPKEMLDKLESTMKQTYNADLRGIKTYKSWSYRHPNGHEIVGVVSVWTQKDAKRVDNIRNWKPKRRQQIIKPVLHKKSNNSELHEGVGMDTDF